MRMATRRRRWIVTSAATVAVAIGVWVAVALAAPTPSAPSPTDAAPVISWSDDDPGGAPAGGYDVERASGGCGGSPSFDKAFTAVPSPFTDSPRPPDGPYCYRVIGHGYPGDLVADVSVVVDTTAPGPFTASAPATVAGGPQIFWTDAADPNLAQYQILRDGPGGHAEFDGVSDGWTDPTVSLAPGMYRYTVQAVDLLGHTTSATNATTRTLVPLTVVVTKSSDSAPQSVAAASPTHATPHITWQRPITFAVTGWQIYRDNALVATLDASALSFDDVGVPAQGLHSYVIRATNGSMSGDASAPVSVVYDTMAPSLSTPTGTANPDGSVSIAWEPASDPSPGAGLSTYIVRRGSPTAPPASATAGTDVCTVTTAATGCIDPHTESGASYGYSIFAIDGAGNQSRQTLTVRALDTVAPDPVAGFNGTVGPTSVHLTWDAPALQGNDADLAGYRIIRLGAGIKQPANPRDGTEVCPGLGFRDNDCFVQNLTTGQPVTFAIYAEDEVPNLSAPTLVTVTPNSSDHKKPGLPTNVRIKRAGAKITMSWVSPKDRDLSKFRVTLYDNGPAQRPSRGKAIVTGRVLHASFALRAGQVVYANVFAIDLSGNFSRVTRLIVMPDRLVQPRSKHKLVKKKAKSRTPPPKKAKKS